ncbi:MAG: hypothetical protein R3F39_09475 [Myxococcota bacterium]
MDTFAATRLSPLLAGVVLSLCALLFGFGMGGAFGAAEDSIKGNLESSASAVLATVYEGDQAKADAVVSKSWSYLKRAHMHAGGIGAAALAMVLLLALLGPPTRATRLVALALGLGAVLYPLFWLLAGLKAPGLGSTGAAKDALEWLAIPGAGGVLLGTFGTLALTIRAGIQARTR